MQMITYRTMKAEDYDSIYRLWLDTEGMGLHEQEDSREGICAFLERNCGLSFIAEAEGKIVGTILTGTDGRRGSFNHLAVAADFRKQGIASKLIKLSLKALNDAGICKCYAYVYKNNTEGIRFWEKMKWEARQDLEMFGNYTDGNSC